MNAYYYKLTGEARKLAKTTEDNNYKTRDNIKKYVDTFFPNCEAPSRCRISISSSGDLWGIPAPSVLPDGFKYIKKYSFFVGEKRLMSPKLNTKKGKEIEALWDSFKIKDIEKPLRKLLDLSSTLSPATRSMISPKVMALNPSGKSLTFILSSGHSVEHKNAKEITMGQLEKMVNKHNARLKTKRELQEA